ncbi:uncharacterized protein DSM5745_00080 [Aspergillus mulundensis]|uniref:F-box domain-containing protein n=1 Tax=Aspergillus mulundensis TaxID=1810919 RepID=A0A3D8T435_9EURO|nr:hypothetical protein DSM5745_00080 [Aspergillus mulundensis]RDW92758.1 hypothetical protein DSM5745_00080 [Aspergillus mulundensis]
MAQQRTADPLEVLNYDCACLIFEQLSAQDLTRGEQVSNSWKSQIQDWVSGHGVRHTSLSALLTGKPRCAMEFTQPLADKPLVTAGDFVAWTAQDGVYWKRVGHERTTAGEWCPFPTEKVRLEISSTTTVEYMKVHVSGFLFIEVRERVAFPEEQYVYRDHLFELSTGKELWSRALTPNEDDARLRPSLSPLALGWEKFYRYGPKANTLEGYDLKTGDLLYTVAIPPEVYGVPAKGRVWRLQGAEILVVVNHNPTTTGVESVLYLFNAQTGNLVQDIKFETPGLPLFYRLTPSSRSGELAFAVTEQGHLMGSSIMRLFTYDRKKGQFVAGETEKPCHVGGGYDPFRSFLIGGYFLYGHYFVISSPEGEAALIGSGAFGRKSNKFERHDFSVERALQARDRACTPQGDHFALVDHVTIVGNRLYSSGMQPGGGIIVVEFGPSPALPLPTEDTLYRPDDIE